ncbi:hypothetical protein ElyMa_003275200 [Elysia marginata]|uniref:Uncharacterized protein n=1 Tax=Elysia marginata TaxID=1093978 RepID=A0AAV4JA76_9GAST|nr:hypothetical protein ElyMa_003275200 [Elysia marginata]
MSRLLFISRNHQARMSKDAGLLSTVSRREKPRFRGQTGIFSCRRYVHYVSSVCVCVCECEPTDCVAGYEGLAVQVRSPR